jgi:C4-dicarboxylate transporter DctM subunit
MTVLILFLGFGVLLIFGIPVAFAIGLASIITAVLTGLPFPVIITKMFGAVDSFAILAVPFFVLAGLIMNQSGVTQRIINFSNSLVGHLRGGLSHVNIFSSMLFAGISGSCIADSAAIGSTLIPRMIEKKYPADFSVAVTASSSTIGPIIPPSLTMVLYSYLTGVSIGAMFLGGAIPGILIGLSLMVFSYLYCKWKDYGKPHRRVKFSKMFHSFLKATWALVMPVIIVGGIVFGIFTATEAGSVAVIYGVIVGFFISRRLTFRSLWKTVAKSAITTGGILFLIATANLFGHLLSRAQFHASMLTFLSLISSDPIVMLLLMMSSILVMGLFIDVGAMVVMFASTFADLANSLGFNPVYFGVIFCMTALIGAVTPPVGVLLFIDCTIAKIPLSSVFKIIWPFVFILFGVTILVLFVPSLVLFLPSLFYRSIKP